MDRASDPGKPFSVNTRRRKVAEIRASAPAGTADAELFAPGNRARPNKQREFAMYRNTSRPLPFAIAATIAATALTTFVTVSSQPAYAKTACAARVSGSGQLAPGLPVLA